MDKKYQLNAEYIITDFETLRVLTDVRRQNILEQLVKQPMTVKEISKRLNISVSKLYYHINMLEEKGMIKVVKTKVVSGIIEKTYLATAMSYQLSDDLLRVKSPELEEGIEGLVLSLLDRVRGAFVASANRGLIEVSKTASLRSLFMDTRLTMTQENVNEFRREFEDLVERYSTVCSDGDQEDDDIEVINLFVMAFPTGEAAKDIQQWPANNQRLADHMIEGEASDEQSND